MKTREDSQVIFDRIYSRGIDIAVIIARNPDGVLPFRWTQLLLIAEILYCDITPHCKNPEYWEERLLLEAKARLKEEEE